MLSGCFVAEKAMAPHSSTLAWKIPWIEEPGGPQSMHGVTQSRTRLKRLSSSSCFVETPDPLPTGKMWVVFDLSFFP